MENITNILEYQKKIKPAGFYGVPFLDDFLCGIMPEDLVVITAETGAGKTQLAYDIAFKNAAAGKVLLFALEADLYEPQLRRYYNILSSLYYNDKSPYKLKQSFSYRNFYLNKLDVSKYEEEAKRIYSQQKEPIIVFREYSFTADDMKKHVLDNIDDLSLIVLDHIDYLDLDIDVPENKQMSDIMKGLREINLSFKIPVVAVSHLRKGNRKTLIPTTDDLMGSGNKGKQAKTIITIAKDKKAAYTPGKFPTYISIPKSRLGPLGNLIALQTFDAATNSYEPEYLLQKYNQFDDTVEFLEPQDYPEWAKRSPF